MPLLFQGSAPGIDEVILKQFGLDPSVLQKLCERTKKKGY
jgi:hypothetical protein